MSDDLPKQLREAMWRPLSDETQASHIASIEGALQQSNVAAPISWRSRIRVVAIAAAILVLPTGLAFAAEDSVPGDALYPLKRVTETFRSLVDADVEAQHRIEELETLIAREADVADIDAQLERAQAEVDALPVDHELRPRLDIVAADLPASRPAARDERQDDPAGDVDVPPSDDGPAVVAAPEDPALDSTTTSTVPSSTTTIRDSTTTTVRPTETTVTDRPSTTLVDDRIDTITSVPITVVGPTETTVVDSATTSSTTSTSTTTTTLADKDEPPEIETYRVSGYVHAGPVCPVEQFPPDPDCEDFAVRGAVMVITTGDGKQVARVETDGNGRFRTELPNGRYTITPQPVPGLLGTASPQNFAVDGARVQLDIAYDTGIR